MKDVQAGLLRYRLALLLIATLLLFILVMLPFSLADVVSDVIGSPYGRRFIVPEGPQATPAPTHARLNLGIVALDEIQQLVTVRVSGHQVCEPACAEPRRLVLFSLPLGDDDSEVEGLPPSAAVTLPTTASAVTESVQLPIAGQPLRYPFDIYSMRLGVAWQRVSPDESAQTLPTAEIGGQLFLTVQEQLPRLRMAPPRPVETASVRVEGAPYGYLHVHDLVVARPIYMRVLAVLLVLLVTAAAAYAVFLRPLEELVVNSGALVLGIWGIRQILVPGNYNFATSVDLSLSIVILFLLSAITVRALLFAHERAALDLPGRAHKPRTED